MNETNGQQIDPTTAYDIALITLRRALSRVQRLAVTIEDAAEKLRDWPRVIPLSPAAIDPRWLPILNVTAIDPTTWPSAAQLAESLLGWQEAWRAADLAHKAIPPDQRPAAHHR